MSIPPYNLQGSRLQLPPYPLDNILLHFFWVIISAFEIWDLRATAGGSFLRVFRIYWDYRERTVDFVDCCLRALLCDSLSARGTISGSFPSCFILVDDDSNARALVFAF